MALLSAGIFVAVRLAAAEVDIEDARRQFLAGDYTGCVKVAEQILQERSYSEEWRLMLTQGLLALGRYAEARTVITNALAEESPSIRLRWLAREAYLCNGQTARAAAVVQEITHYVQARSWAYRDARNLVTFGRVALLISVDPKVVLDKLFKPAKESEPDLRDAHLAIGGLALEKHDFALAAKAFQEGLKKLPDDPDLHFGLARAYAPSEPALMIASLEAALQRNTNHIPSLLLLADHRIDAEDYAEADKLLDRVKTVNPWHPEAWAYRAILAHLRNQPEAEKTARQTALKYWPTNPRVDHLIGLKLSQKYRFAEGADHQRQALRFDRTYLPAKAQLAQDLLRLGEEAEGWRLADEVQHEDGYDVAANNLLTLHDTMGKFQTLTNSHFHVRMSPPEAALYGSRVLELLEEAQARLCAKYKSTLTWPVLVEIFPEQKDFAVRTFGMPENHGFLGVCFGSVVTANSPASRPGQHFNWEAMLWHEFCHVVTLQLTRNKMPRWLSEGISVFEERQANPAWGERLIPRYREMILGGELAPVSKLSAAFLAPKSAAHLQFAYYESSLVVQFLAEQFGFEQLAAILRDLGEGMTINEAIEKHTAPMARIEKDFAAFAKQTAENMAPGLDWEKPSLETQLPGAGENAWTIWAAARPNNFWVLTRRAQQFMDDKEWSKAKTILEKLVELYPGFTGPDSAYRMLAATHRALGETNEERQVLARFAEKDGDAADAYQRLMDLAAEARDWPAVVQTARRYLAVNPLVVPPYRLLAQASEQTGETQSAISAYRALLQLDPPNPAEVHFKLARQLQRAGDPSAKRQVLQALEEAPRYRDALHLLVELAAAPTEANQATNLPAPARPATRP